MTLDSFFYVATRIRTYLSPAIKKLLPEFLAAALRTRANQLIGPASLYMLLSDLGTIQPIKIPPGYHSAALSPGYEMDYVRVMRQSLVAEADMDWFRRTFSNDHEYNPDNLLLIYEDTTPIAAAAAWQMLSGAKRAGLVHMVGVDMKYQGRGLGRVITLLVLHRLKERGFTAVMAATEDFRIPALSLYLSLGFKPLYRHRSDEKRWKRVMQKRRLRSF
jgi:mycothiol synthase